MYKPIAGALAVLCLLSQSVHAGTTPRLEKATLYIGWPNDREVIYKRRFRVWFGMRNMGIAPAGVAKPNTGHHHLLIDTELPPLNEEIPSNRNHVHFGAGQSETTIELPPGRHTLQLLLADDKHIPHDPPLVSRKVTVTVK